MTGRIGCPRCPSARQAARRRYAVPGPPHDPRQCGKTTLARSLARSYFNLEAPEERTRLDARWEEAVSADGPVVLDEAQHWPELFSRLRGVIDSRRKKNGRFVLLGSIAPALMRGGVESLAGRMAVLELSPFLLGEVGKMIEATRLTLLCRVARSTTTGTRWIANLPDYLRATA